jgi:hypothetical protein
MRDARPHLHARSFAPERQPGADREEAAEELAGSILNGAGGTSSRSTASA